MYRGLLHAAAWSTTTAAAVMLSWFGVHSVLRSTAYDLPRALPITETAAGATPDPGPSAPPPLASSTHRPRPTTPPPRTTGTALPPKSPPSAPATPTAPASAHPTASAGTTTSPPASADDVHSYTVPGGRAVLALAPTSASLVSATPAADWKMQVWTQTGWLRVTFTAADGRTAWTVLCTWNDHPPSVETYEDQ